MTGPVDLTEVQSLVLRPRPAVRIDIAFVRVADRAALGPLLHRAAEVVDVAATSDPTAPALNVGLTAAAVRLAGVDDRTYRALSGPFRDGMRDAAERLGDTGDSAPERWEAPFRPGDGPVHLALVALGPATDAAAPPPVDWRGLDAVAAGAVAVWTGIRRGGVEPFGFRDDVSLPTIEGTPRAVRPGNGVWDPEAREWRAVRAGEAVLGHLDEADTVSGHPDAALVERDGSYLVLRRLRQDVAAFHAECARIAHDLGIAGDGTGSGADVVAERIVGRRRDGRPLGPTDRDDRNDFLYRDGSAVARAVPPSSHIRRTNPRDDVENAGRLLPRHVVFRRGIPYGTPGGDEGLLFMAVGADIRRQFEFVQSHWVMDGSRFGLGREQDPLLGAPPPGGERALSICADDGSRLRCATTERFVATRGGEYLLLPSRTALRHLARVAGHR